VNGMLLLSDEVLIESYQTAIQMGLEREFILLLRREIERRNLNVGQPDQTPSPKTAAS